MGILKMKPIYNKMPISCGFGLSAILPTINKRTSTTPKGMAWRTYAVIKISLWYREVILYI